MTNMKSNTDITRIILGIIKVAGLLSIAIVAPNVIGALAKMGVLENKKYHPTNYIRRRVSGMIGIGLLRKVNRDGRVSVELTEKGERKLQKYRSFFKEKNKKWDGYWRIIIFDVWEKRRWSRDALRSELRNYGFVQLQRSVWVYPYPCGEFIELLKVDLRFGKNVRYIIAKKIDDDVFLK